VRSLLEEVLVVAVGQRMYCEMIVLGEFIGWCRHAASLVEGLGGKMEGAEELAVGTWCIPRQEGVSLCIMAITLLTNFHVRHDS